MKSNNKTNTSESSTLKGGFSMEDRGMGGIQGTKVLKQYYIKQ